MLVFGILITLLYLNALVTSVVLHFYLWDRLGAYAVKVKRHNVCKRHVAIDTGFKQTERTIFLCVISMGKI